jgi:hypothetical protein
MDVATPAIVKLLHCFAANPGPIVLLMMPTGANCVLKAGCTQEHEP